VASPYDLAVTIRKSDDLIGVELDYNPAAFDPGFAERFGSHFNCCLSYLSDVGVPLRAIDVIPADEKRRLLSNSGGISKSLPAEPTLHQLFEQQAERTPEAVAVWFGDKSLTYRQLNEKANQLAYALRTEYGVGKDELVGLMLDRSDNIVAGILGILKAGGAYVPIAPEHPSSRKQYIVDDASIRVLVTQADYIGTLTVAHQVDVTSPELSRQPKTNLPGPYSADQLAYGMYTSGTTGHPKCALIPHRAVINLCEWLSEVIYRPSPAPLVAMLTASVNFDASVQQLLVPLLNGSSVLVASDTERKNPELFVDRLLSRQADVLDVTPSFLQVLLQVLEGRPEQPRLQYTLVGGEALSGQLSDRYYQVLGNSKLINVYGVAEAAVDSTFEWVTPGGPGTPPIGKPIHNTNIYVLDGQLNLLPLGITGEICIAGAGLGRGYLNRTELTKEKFVPDPFDPTRQLYRTGDLGRWLDNGKLQFVARKDGQLKFNGQRIEPAEISLVLEKHPLIRQSVVEKRTAANGDDMLVAYYVAEAPVEQSALRSFLGEHLPQSIIPTHFVPLDRVPTTLNGKVDRAALPDPETAAGVAAEAYVAPRDATEIKLADIWESVLGKEKIGIDENFYNIGGHSLKATRVIARIYKEFNAKVEMKTLFTYSTIRELGREVSALARNVYKEIVNVGKEKYYDVSHAQHRMWVLDQLEGGSLAYIIAQAQRIKGNLNRPAFEKAFYTLVKRHESLRTCFVTVQGKLRQKINSFDESNFRLEYLDLRQEPDREAKARTLTDAEAATGFDLATGPLVRAKFLHLDDQEYVFLLTMHHIVTDGWSMETLIREVTTLYGAYQQGQPDPLPPLRIQYKDYAHWHNNLLTGNQLNVHSQYWKKKLGGELPVLKLPVDYASPNVNLSKGSSALFLVDPLTHAKLKQLCQQREVSLFMLLTAATSTLLYRYSGQEDIILATPVAGRDHPDLEEQIGLYVNTLLLRMQFSGEDRFADLLAKVRQTTLDAFEHQIYPFDLLSELLDRKAVLANAPLFSAGITFERADAYTTADSDYDKIYFSNFGTASRSVKAPLWFLINESTNELTFELEYSTELFNAVTIDRLISSFKKLLSLVAADPLVRLQALGRQLTEYEEGLRKESIKRINDKTQASLLQFKQGR
jgi:amino acid adenylation domain-containing protein